MNIKRCHLLAAGCAPLLDLSRCRRTSGASAVSSCGSGAGHCERFPHFNITRSLVSSRLNTAGIRVEGERMTKTITVEELIGPPFYFQVDGRFIRWDRFKEIAFKQPTIIDKVTAIKRGKSNKVLCIRFPIIGNSNIALLVAKAMGDGHLSHDFRFTYYNSENTLIDEVIAAVEKTIGQTDYYRWNERDSSNCFRVRFPSVVGYLLYLFGAPTGEKVRKEFGVPEWIKNGSHEIKAAFLRGLFDDECTIVVPGEKNRTRSIVLAMGKAKLLEDSLLRFLNELKIILSELGIQSKNISFQQQNKDVVIFRFWITGREQIELFRTIVGSSHPNKDLRLNIIHSTYKDLHKTRRAITDLLLKAKSPMTARQIAKSTEIKYDATRAHLLERYKKGELTKTATKPAWWRLKRSDTGSNETRLTVKPGVEAALQTTFQDISQ